MLYIQELQGRLTAAIDAGMVTSLETYEELERRGIGRLEPAPVLYVRSDDDRPHQTEVVYDRAIDAEHNDVLVTYDDVLKTVSVRLYWSVSRRSELVPTGFWVWPKGRTSGLGPLFCWQCPARWNGLSEKLRLDS